MQSPLRTVRACPRAPCMQASVSRLLETETGLMTMVWVVWSLCTSALQGPFFPEGFPLHFFKFWRYFTAEGQLPARCARFDGSFSVAKAADFSNLNPGGIFRKTFYIQRCCRALLCTVHVEDCKRVKGRRQTPKLIDLIRINSNTHDHTTTRLWTVLQGLTGP